MLQKRPDAVLLTQAGLDQFKAEFDRLTQERPQILTRLQAAREMGDLSENGAYHAAKWELGRVDRQLRKLNYLITYAKVVASTTVTLELNGKTVSYTLVSKHESDPSKGKISFESPLGQLLVGKQAGDQVTLERDGNQYAYLIKSIQ